MRTSQIVAAAACFAVTLVPAVPASASAGCGGAYTGPETCSFPLGTGDTGFALSVTTDPGTVVAARARWFVTERATGVRIEVLGVSCAVGGPNGGTCGSSSPAFPSAAYDSAVECELVSLDGGPISGTWSCSPTA